MPGWADYSNTESLWDLFHDKLNRLCTAWANGHLIPLLESDVAAYLYHLFISDFGGNASQLHIDTRMHASDQRKKYDLIIGTVLSTEEQKAIVMPDYRVHLEGRGISPSEIEKRERLMRRKSTKSDFRPAVDASLILELKLLRGPGSLKHVKEDIRKLGGVAPFCPEGRAVVLFDDKGVLTDGRRRDILADRGPADPDLRIYVCGRLNSGQASWVRLPP